MFRTACLIVCSLVSARLCAEDKLPADFTIKLDVPAIWVEGFPMLATVTVEQVALDRRLWTIVSHYDLASRHKGGMGIYFRLSDGKG